MGLQAQLIAQLVTGPALVSDSQFPSGVTSFNFGLNPPEKQYSVDTGAMVSQTNSPSAFATLPGIGAAGTVTQALTLYIRVQTPMQIRMTFVDPLGGPDIVSIEPINGVKLCEYPPNGYLKLLEVKGSGQVEYYASGLQ